MKNHPVEDLRADSLASSCDGSIFEDEEEGRTVIPLSLQVFSMHVDCG